MEGLQCLAMVRQTGGGVSLVNAEGIDEFLFDGVEVEVDEEFLAVVFLVEEALLLLETECPCLYLS